MIWTQFQTTSPMFMFALLLCSVSNEGNQNKTTVQLIGYAGPYCDLVSGKVKLYAYYSNRQYLFVSDYIEHKATVICANVFKKQYNILFNQLNMFFITNQQNFLPKLAADVIQPRLISEQVLGDVGNDVKIYNESNRTLAVIANGNAGISLWDVDTNWTVTIKAVGSITAVVKQGSRVFAAGDAISMFDTSDLNNVVKVWSGLDIDRVSSLEIDINNNNTLFVVCASELIIINITSTPVVLSRTMIPQPGYSLAQKGSKLYLAAGHAGLLIFDALNVTLPQIINVTLNISDVFSARIIDDNIYILSRTGLTVLNILNFSVLGSLQFSVMTQSIQLIQYEISGLHQHFAFITCKFDGLVIVNASIASEMYVYDSIQGFGESYNIAVLNYYSNNSLGKSQNNIYIFTTDPKHGITYFNATSILTVKWGWGTQSEASSIVFIDRFSIVSSINCLFVIDNSIIQEPNISNQICTNSKATFKNIEIQDQKLVALMTNIVSNNFFVNLYNFDVLNGELLLLGTLALQAAPQSVKIMNNLAFIACGSLGLLIVNITTNTPIDTKIIPYGGIISQGQTLIAENVFSYDVFLSQNKDMKHAFVSDTFRGFIVLDITDTNNIKEIVQYDIQTVVNASTFVASAVIDNTVIYLSLFGYGVAAVSFVLPKHPYIMSIYKQVGSVLSMSLFRGKLYMADLTTGIHILNVTDPSNLQQIGSYATDGQTNALVINDQFAYIADGSGGYKILQVFGLSSILINESNPIAQVGSTVSFNVSGSFCDNSGDGPMQPNYSANDITMMLDWITSNSSVALIQQKGVVQILAVGNSTITLSMPVGKLQISSQFIISALQAPVVSTSVSLECPTKKSVYFSYKDFQAAFAQNGGGNLTMVKFARFPLVGTMRSDGVKVTEPLEVQLDKINRVSWTHDGSSWNTTFEWYGKDNYFYSENKATATIVVRQDLEQSFIMVAVFAGPILAGLGVVKQMWNVFGQIKEMRKMAQPISKSDMQQRDGAFFDSLVVLDVAAVKNDDEKRDRNVQ